MPKPRAQTLTKVCERCGEEFTVPNKVNYREKRFCTRACSNAATAEKRAATLRSKEGYQHPLCPCGKRVEPPPGQKWIYKTQKKYCSPECRARYGKKRQPDPANYRTFKCQNCGTEVTRRKSQGQHKYCSNECAAKHTKTKKHIVVDDAIVLDSGYEALLWGLCALHKVPIERYNREQGVAWREGCWYAPDFLVANEIAVELKGLQDDEDELKWSAFRTQIRPLVVLDGGRLREHLGSMVTRDGLIAVLWGLMDEGTWSCERDDCPVEREHQTMRDARLCKGEPPAPPGLEDLQNNGIATITKTP